MGLNVVVDYYIYPHIIMRWVDRSTRWLLLNVARHLRASGRGTKAVVVELIRSLSARSVVILRDDAMVADDLMDRCHRWADDHLGFLAPHGRTPRVHGKSLINLCRVLLRDLWPDQNVSAAFDAPVDAGLAVSLIEELEVDAGAGDEREEAAAVPALVAQPPFGDDGDEDPAYLDDLPPAPELPEVGRTRDALGWVVITCASGGHRHYRLGKARVGRERVRELDALLSRVSGLSRRRAWSVVGPPPDVAGARSLFPPVGDGCEEVLGVFEGEAFVLSDRLWRMSRRHMYYLRRRDRLAFPEEVCLLMGWPERHVVIDELARQVTTRVVLRYMTQGVHGVHAELMAAIFDAVASVDRRRVRAGFWGSGPLNTVAMVFDRQLGSGRWDYALRVEGNPANARVHDQCWGERVMATQDRVESRVEMPEGVAPPSDCVLSLRCQPWSRMNRAGLDQMEGAMRERSATYQSVSAITPDVVVDEMLSRSRMSGQGLLWQRVEYMRQQAFGAMEWVVLDSDPGDGEGEFARSRRELAVGYRVRFAAAVRAVLEGAGYVPV